MTTATAAVIPEVTLGLRLMLALRQSPLTAQDVADEFQMNRATISRWMNDHGAPPKAVYIKHWALMTGVDQHWLLTGEARPVNPDGVGPVGLEPTTNGLEVPGFADRNAVILTFPAGHSVPSEQAA